MSELAEVMSLDEAEIRALLHGADPVLRLHAAWALGFRARDAGVSAAHRLMLIEPHPGVRRHLAVMLGGDVAALAALVDLDPSERVRETALRLLVQSWPREDRSGIAALVIRTAREDPSDDVRLSALELVSALREHIELTAIEPLLDSADPRIRWAAVDAILASDDEVSVRLVARFGIRGDAETRRRTWQILFARQHHDWVLCELRDAVADAAIVAEAMDLLGADRELAFDSLAWVERYAPALDAQVLRAVHPQTIPHAWLVERAARVPAALATDDASWTDWRALWVLADLGHSGVTIDAASGPALQDLRAALSDRAAWERIDDWDEADGVEAGGSRRHILGGLASLAGGPPPDDGA